jgi:hypothetical protein
MAVEQSGGFELEAEKPRRFSDDRLKELIALYRVDASPRTLRRWIANGANVEDPVSLKKWWVTQRTHNTVPDWLHRAASAATQPPVVVEKADAPSAPPVTSGESVNLSDYQLGEGAAVSQQRSLVAALWAQLERAYLSPTTSDVDVLQAKYNKAVEALRRLEKDDLAFQKERGLMIPRVTVQRDIAAACELIRQMSETEKRRVLELCPTLGPEQRAEVAAAIDRICEVRTRVFRNLKSLKTTDDALLQFTAA